MSANARSSRARFPHSRAIEVVLRGVRVDLDLRPGELEEFFSARIWQMLTSCEDHRLDLREAFMVARCLDADRFSTPIDTS